MQTGSVIKNTSSRREFERIQRTVQQPVAASTAVSQAAQTAPPSNQQTNLGVANFSVFKDGVAVLRHVREMDFGAGITAVATGPNRVFVESTGVGSGMPNGTIHQTLRHDGASPASWVPTDRVKVREDAVIPGAWSLGSDEAGVRVRGWGDGYPLLQLGDSTSTDTGWVMRLNAPQGYGIYSETLGPSYFLSHTDSDPYCFKIACAENIVPVVALEVESGNDAPAIYARNEGMAAYLDSTGTLAHSAGAFVIGVNKGIIGTVRTVNGAELGMIEYAGVHGYLDNSVTGAFGAATSGWVKSGAPTQCLAGYWLNDNVLGRAGVVAGSCETSLVVTNTKVAGTGVAIQATPLTTAAWALHAQGRVVSDGLNAGFYGIGTNANYYREGLQVLGTRRTGWTAATGTATRTTFNTATVTLPQLAERVKALIDDFLAHGSIGA